MAIVRWDPFETFLGVQDDLNRLFRTGWLRRSGADDLSGAAVWAPAVDIYETDDSLVVEAEVPGVDPKDIDLSVDEGVLSLKGERRQEKEVKDENYYRVERSYGSFQRAIRLPSEVEADKVKASYDGGVLKVSIPKKAPKKPKSIPIQVEAKK